jgi:hypothetical protein
VYFNDFDNKDNKFRLNRIVFPLRDKRYLTFFSQFRSVSLLRKTRHGRYCPQKRSAFRCPLQCIAMDDAMHCVCHRTALHKKDHPVP